ncbi:hypothetical protein PT974_06045 [Cladobotryum mycophilum]|uniref:Uncharacterized protein n=1 Tax=Cladobotryum mycophilum TaxID=491253 RepID=A0ABR0SLJ6_9HYPO
MLAKFLRLLYSLLRAENKRPTNELDSREYDVDDIYEPNGAVSVIGRSIVTNYTLSNHVQHAQTLEGATGYTFVTDPARKTLDRKSLLKQMTKSAASLEKISCLLRGNTKNAASYIPATNPQAVAIIGQGTFISRPELPDLQKDADMSEIYTKIRFEHFNGLASTQYFKAHCSTIKPHAFDIICAGRFKSISINTGLCLFSKSVLNTSPGQGKGVTMGEKPTIPPLPQNSKPTLYELEIVARLSSAIADTVGLVGEPHRDGTTPISINIDIPDFQYYWTACELLEHNLVTVEYVKNWIAAIDKRRRQLKAIMISMIHTTLKDRGLGHVEVQLSTGTEAAVALVKDTVYVGLVPTLEEIIRALRSQGHEASRWNAFLDNLDARHQPQTVGELSKLMYVFKSVKVALDDIQDTATIVTGEEDKHGPSLTIQVDDVNEWRIFDRAKAILQEHSKRVGYGPKGAVIIGLFPMQRIFAACRGRSDLYNEECGDDLILATEKTVISPLDVIGTTHGMHVARRLRHFYKQEGLL